MGYIVHMPELHGAMRIPAGEADRATGDAPRRQMRLARIQVGACEDIDLEGYLDSLSRRKYSILYGRMGKHPQFRRGEPVKQPDDRPRSISMSRAAVLSGFFVGTVSRVMVI